MGKGFLKRLMALWKLGLGVLVSFRILRRFGADLVIGVGGYASFPVMLAARFLKIPRVIQEQNTIPGLTNRMLGKWADRVYVAFEQALCHFPQGKGKVTGNPVRNRLLKPVPPPKREKFTVLVIGGSQGARELNQAMMDALDTLEGIRDSVKIIHQTGERDAAGMAAAYGKKGFDAEVYPFISDMERVYGIANLVVCRAGALTLAELAAFRRASILIPYPFAANGHQEANACELVIGGAARMILSSDLSGPLLAQEIIDLFRKPDLIGEMEKRTGGFSMPDAARLIVDDCYGLVREVLSV